MRTFEISRIFAIAVRLSISGIIMSSRIRWIFSCFTTSSASLPVYARNRV